jgi:Family of unknown function (DUF6516)
MSSERVPHWWTVTFAPGSSYPIVSSQLEFSEYMRRSSEGEIAAITYSYHWANADNELIKRWDNAPHFPDLPGFPDHIHDGATGEVTSGQPMRIFAVLDEIAGRSL